MNAIQFIQQHGLTQAKECLSNCACPDDKWFIHEGDLVSDSDFDELNRLVESVDLVNKLGGFVVAKEKLAYGNSISAMRLSYKTTITDRDGTKQNVITGVYLEDLEQAISDYEAIYSDNNIGDCEILDFPEDYTSPNCKKFDERVR